MPGEHLPRNDQRAGDALAPSSISIEPLYEKANQGCESDNMKPARVERTPDGKSTQTVNHSGNNTRPAFELEAARVAKHRHERNRESQLQRQRQRPRSYPDQINPIDRVENARRPFGQKWLTAVNIGRYKRQMALS